MSKLISAFVNRLLVRATRSTTAKPASTGLSAKIDDYVSSATLVQGRAVQARS